MAAPIYSYRPEIKLIVATNDVTKHLGDVGSVTVRKNIYEPAGNFQIIFPDLPVEGWRESLYGLVRPLDQIQIWVRRWREPNASIEPWVPILTGFIRSIGRDETVGGDGRVQRRVVLAGQDAGAAFLMEQVYAFITFQNRGTGLGIPELAWLQEYDLKRNPIAVEEFIWGVATKSTEDIMTQVDLEFQKRFTVKRGTVLPNKAFSQEGTIWEMLKTYSDAPWNELFVRENRKMDGEDVNPELVFRPTPWYDYDDNPLPDFEPEEDDTVSYWEVPLADVVSMSAHRDDSELVNHAWVLSSVSNAAAMTQATKESSGIVNDDTRKKFGDRIIQLPTNLSPVDSAHPMNLPMSEQREAERQTVNWVLERREWLKLAHQDIHKFERGSVTMKGYPHLRVGDYFRLSRGDIIWEGYITNISHQFNAYRQYLTTLDYIRGNQWKRRQEIDGPWDKERKQALIG